MQMERVIGVRRKKRRELYNVTENENDREKMWLKKKKTNEFEKLKSLLLFRIGFDLVCILHGKDSFAIDYYERKYFNYVK